MRTRLLALMAAVGLSLGLIVGVPAATGQDAAQAAPLQKVCNTYGSAAPIWVNRPVASRWIYPGQCAVGSTHNWKPRSFHIGRNFDASYRINWSGAFWLSGPGTAGIYPGGGWIWDWTVRVTVHSR